MTDESINPEDVPLPKKVNCAICHREIPRSDAIKDEAEEYIRWYCGFDCYHKAQSTAGKN